MLPIREQIPVTFSTVCRRVKYFGLGYKCPFCRSFLGAFLPAGFKFPVLREKKVVGAGFREKALCPVCGSKDRERLLYFYLRNRTDAFEKPQKVLHVAPEPRLAVKIRKNAPGDYLSGDLRPGKAMIEMDIMDIQFPDDSFDIIICSHVLEHVADDRRGMSELYRILKKGGLAILQVPIALALEKTREDSSIANDAGREEAFGQKDHVRLYAGDYRERLETAGFRVDLFDWCADIDKFGGRKNRYGLNPEEDIFLARKV